MNEVYISGFVSGNPVLKMEKDSVPHLLFYVDIQHKTKSGKIHHEMYTVNAWYNVALRAADKLKNGQYVMLRGYLTQKSVRSGDMSYMLTEITVKDFVSSNLHQNKKEMSGIEEIDQKMLPVSTEEHSERAAE